MDKWTSILVILGAVAAVVGLTAHRWKANNNRREREKAERWAQNGKMKRH